MTCRILVPWPGIEPVTSAVQVKSPNHWTVGEFPTTQILYYCFIFLYYNMPSQIIEGYTDVWALYPLQFFPI